MNRTDARMIAEELCKLMRPQIERIVKEIVVEQTDKWLDTKQAAEMLGWEIKTLYNKIGEVPHTKVGKKLRFSEASLNEFISRR